MKYLVVYQPKVNRGYKYCRFLVSINQLHKYIGEKNAYNVLCACQSLTMDKRRLKFRKFGTIDIYLK